jgi:glycosyltransferase involved in cell wall biosynthesis
MNPGIEVAICTHNGSLRLPLVLEALAGQTLAASQWSVLVVDNASTDGTEASVRRLWRRRDVALRVVNEPRLGVKMARLRAFAESNRDLLCFCDDDNLLANDYLERAVRMMAASPRAGAMGGQGEPATEVPLPDWFPAAAPGYAVGPQAESEGRISDARGFVYGAGMIVRIAAWSEIRQIGFEPRLMSREGNTLNCGEDNEICLMLRLVGWQIHYSPALRFRHLIAPQKLDERYCRSLYHGFGEATAVLNTYRDFLVGRASTSGWLACAYMRLIQGWVARAVDQINPSRKLPLSPKGLRQEIAGGFAAGCRRYHRRGTLLKLYSEIALWLENKAARQV